MNELYMENETDKGRKWFNIGRYYAANVPDKYIIGWREEKLLFYGIDAPDGAYINEFYAILYDAGEYKLCHIYNDRTARGENLLPFPTELLDDENSVSMGELSAWCKESSESSPIGCGPKTAEWLIKQGLPEKARRCWQPEDRIRLLQL